MTIDWLAGHRAVIRVASGALPVAVAAALGLLRDELAPSTAAIVLVLTVVGAAATGDRVAGVTAALASAAAFDFFLTSPYFSLAIRDRNDVLLASVMVVVGLAVTELALWGHRQQAAALERSGYLEGVLSISDIIATGSDSALSTSVGAAISKVLGVDRVAWSTGVPSINRPMVARDGTVRLAGLDMKAGRRGLPTEVATVIPVNQREVVIGHFEVVAATHVVRPNRDQLRAAVLLADQMARWERPTPGPQARPLS